MKGNITVSVDAEIKEFLKNSDNASGLINDLLKTHFGKQGTIDRDKNELLKKIAENQAAAAKNAAEGRILAEQLAAKEKDEQLTKEVFKAIPERILEDFRIYPKMTPDILKRRFNDIYLRAYKINWQDLLNAYNVYFNKEQPLTTESQGP